MAKEDVVRVYKRPKIGRGPRALIGIGIGVAVAAVADAKVGARYRNEGAQPLKGWETAAAYTLGVVAGGAGGAATGGDETIYRRVAPLR
jgi:hypothetical protein